MLLACFWRSVRHSAPGLLWIAPLPALAASLFATGKPLFVLDQPYSVALVLDKPGAMLLGVAALLWMAAGIYALTFLRSEPHKIRFVVCWLLTLTGNIGVFVTADMASFYLAFALVSIPTYGFLLRNAARQCVGTIYIMLALLGETFLLFAFVLLAATAQSLVIQDCVTALSSSPWRDATLALLIAGFGLKAGLVPFHVWMPLTYTAAPIPAAAVLSGAVVKAGVIGLIRFLPLTDILPGCGDALIALGLLSAFYGVAIGITQNRPKTVLAYSSISQMGFIVAVLGRGLIDSGPGAGLGVAFYAAHHVLAKGALFLAIGATTACSPARRLWLVSLPASVVALGLAGLPLTGGALAKLAVKDALGHGIVALLSTLSAAGSTLLMLHFLFCLQAIKAGHAPKSAPGTAVWAWLGTACAAVIAPWLLYLTVLEGNLTDALAGKQLMSALWPNLVGVLLVLGLRRWRRFVPIVPPGDIVVAGEKIARASVAWGAEIERADSVLRSWPIACLSLLLAAILLAALPWLRQVRL